MTLDLLSHAHLGQPLSAHGLTLVPLFSKHAPVDFALCTAALDASAVTVTESPRRPSVPTLHATNRGPSAALLPAELLLVGGWQDRVTTQPVWLPPGGAAPVPVHCVEQGRWSARAGAGEAARFRAAPAPLDLVRGRARLPNGQGHTWDVVAAGRQRRGLDRPGGSAHEGRNLARLDAAARDLALPWAATGVIAVWQHPGETAWPLVLWSAERRGFHAAWADHRRALLETHAGHLTARGRGLAGARAPRVTLSQMVRRLGKLRSATVARTTRCGPGAQADQLVRARSGSRLDGWATRRDGRLLHLHVTRQLIAA
jgi:hypothetical protein